MISGHCAFSVTPTSLFLQHFLPPLQSNTTPEQSSGSSVPASATPRAQTRGRPPAHGCESFWNSQVIIALWSDPFLRLHVPVHMCAGSKEAKAAMHGSEKQEEASCGLRLGGATQETCPSATTWGPALLPQGTKWNHEAPCGS